MADLTFIDRDGTVYPVRSSYEPMPEPVRLWAAECGATWHAVLDAVRRGVPPPPNAPQRLAEGMVVIVRILIPDLPRGRVPDLHEAVAFVTWWAEEWHKAHKAATPVQSA